MRNNKNARECKIELVDTLDIDIDINVAEISISNELEVHEVKFNRAKTKKETENLIKEWEDEWEI